MIKFLNVIFVLLVLSSCKYQNKEVKKIEKSYEQIVAEELATNKRFDTIFLNFRFYMTETQLQNHYKQLVKEGKLKKVQNELISFRGSQINYSGYLYDFHLKSDVLKTFITESYNSDSLFSMTLNIYGGYYSSTKSNLIDLYNEKYGSYKKDTILEYTSNSVIWINGNREIIVSTYNGNGYSITYNDLIAKNSIIQAEQEKKKLDKLNKQKKSSNIKTEI